MIVTIISVFVSAIIAYVIARWQMKRNKIVHFSISSNDIGKGLSSEFPEFHLTYKNESLANDVEVLKGGFMNVGRKDIDGFKGDADIQLILPKGSVLKAINISPSSKELKINAKKDNKKDNIIHFGICDIFMKDEYFEYTAIVEVNKDINNLHDNLNFRHRIKNTEKIKNTYIGQSYKKINTKRKLIRYFLILTLIIAVVFLIFYSFYSPLRCKIYDNSTNEAVKICMDPFSNLYIMDNLINMHKISIEDFQNFYRISPILDRKWEEYALTILYLILMVIYIILMYLLLIVKNSHIINILKKQKEKERNNM